MIKFPSAPRNRVLRNPIFSISPDMPPTVMLSPTTKGKSKKMVKEANKFSSVSRAAKAKAKPPNPKPVMRAITSTWKTWPNITNPEAVIIKTMDRSLRNGMNCCFDFCSTPCHFSWATRMATFIRRTMSQVTVYIKAISKAFSIKNRSPNSLMGVKCQVDGICICWTAKNKKIQKMSNSKGFRMSWTQS